MSRMSEIHAETVLSAPAPDDPEQEPQPQPGDAELEKAYGITAAKIDAFLAEHPGYIGDRADVAIRLYFRRINRRPTRRMSAAAQEHLSHRQRTMRVRRIGA